MNSTIRTRVSKLEALQAGSGGSHCLCYQADWKQRIEVIYADDSGLAAKDDKCVLDGNGKCLTCRLPLSDLDARMQMMVEVIYGDEIIDAGALDGRATSSRYSKPPR